MKKMGEQKPKEAREDFTFLIMVNVAVGLVMTMLGYSLMKTILELWVGLTLIKIPYSMMIALIIAFLENCYKSAFLIIFRHYV